MLFALSLALAASARMLSLPLPKAYVCYRAEGPIKIDGNLDDPAWKAAAWTDDFEDIVGATKPKPRFRTRAKMLWDRENLYIGAEIEEPQIWATLTRHDSVIFQDNDFEVFIDPDNDGCFYSELELNALNTTWDLLLPRSYRGGGPAIDGFELAGLKTAVHVDGRMNDPLYKSRGWTVEIAIPWTAFRGIAFTSLPPSDRDQWRINFSRVEWMVDTSSGAIVKVPGRPEDNWVWSPQGVVDMHRPEQWGFLQFADSAHGPVAVLPSAGFEERRIMIEIWEALQTYHRTHGVFPARLSELDVPPRDVVYYPGLTQFQLCLNGFSLDQSLRFSKLEPQARSKPSTR